MLGGVEIGEDPAKQENIVGAFAGGDIFCLSSGSSHAALLLCFPADSCAVEHDDISSVGAASVGAGGPVGVGVGLERIKRES